MKVTTSKSNKPRKRAVSLYFRDELMVRLKAHAAKTDTSVSRYLAALAERDMESPK